jgi:hypothetical protein
MNRRFSLSVVVLLLAALCVTLVYAEKACPSCGTGNKDTDKFCKNCGAKLPEAQSPRPQAPRVAGSISVDAGTVSIGSDPSGSTVVVDGRNRGKTPVELRDLAPGRHDVEISRSGYRTYYGDFTIAGLYGSLVILTDPAGAEVTFDNEPRGAVGQDGLSLPRVPYGRHTVTARLSGYRDVTKSYDVNTPGPVTVTLKLGWGKGFLEVTSDPSSATLLMDNKPAGKTPYAGELQPARYVLTVMRRGYYDWVGVADVQYAETVHVKAILDRIQTRKWPFLALSLAGLAYGGYSAFMGEGDYRKYKAAATPADARKYHLSTLNWDMKRNVGLAIGAGVGVAFVVVKW